jgi:hypothetical protein
MFKARRNKTGESGANCIKPSSGSLCIAVLIKKKIQSDEIVAARLVAL